MAKSITYNGVTYTSTKAFETPTLPWTTILARLNRGYSPEEAIKDKYMHPNLKSITYNSVTYPSIQAFAKAFETPTLP